MPAQARDVNLDIKRVVAYRHWCNKLWNAVRFALLNLGDGFLPASLPGQASWPDQAAQQRLPLPCRWILSRLSAATQATVGGLESYMFASATQVLHPMLEVRAALLPTAMFCSVGGAILANKARCRPGGHMLQLLR